MTVEKAIKQLQKLPKKARLRINAWDEELYAFYQDPKDKNIIWLESAEEFASNPSGSTADGKIF